MGEVKGKNIDVMQYNPATKCCEKKYTGICLGIGVDYEEFEDGVGNYSCFIVLKKCGNVRLEPMRSCKF